MATSLTITLESTCAGGGHAFLSTSINGKPARKRNTETDDLRRPLSDDEEDQFVLLCARVSLAGLTRNQARTKLQTGISVDIA